MTRALQVVKRHPWRTALAMALVVLAGAAFAARDVIRLAVTPDDRISYALPLVEPLTPGAGETVYRIDAERSTAKVQVEEQLAGVGKQVELTTHGISGDVGVPSGDLSAARLGDIAVDVHQLESDNALRDKVIRHEALESHDHPVVQLTGATVEGLDGTATDGREAEFAVVGDLVVKGERHPIRFDATASVTGDELHATATARTKMSDLGVGPITKAGLVSTSDDLTIELDLVAVDGADFTPAKELRRERDEEVRSTSGPSFARDVRPILSENCASCHQSGEAGAMAWTLDTAGDAADVADGLAVVTGSGYMPPWPASDVGVPLQHSRKLSSDDVALLKDWAAAGGQLDVARSSEVPPPSEPEVAIPRADVTLPLPEPYQGGPANMDDYRCFVLDPGFTQTTYLTGYVFTPDQTEVVHHALVYRVAAADRPLLDAKDAADPGSGFSCVGGIGAGSTQGDLVAGWVPGQRPAKFADGDGFEFQAGDVLVSQIHYHYEAESPPDRSTIALQVTTDPTGITPLVTRELQAPVELPCPADVTGVLCDRAAAVADAGVRFGPAGSIIPDALHRLCRTTPEQVAAASGGYTGTTVCDSRVGRPGEIIDVLGHMHNLGTSFRMTLNPGTPGEKVLLDIPTWNFDWQLNYQPVEPVRVERGDTIRIECNWDRRLRFDPVPRYIVFAEGTNDEMCFATYTTRPDP